MKAFLHQLFDYNYYCNKQLIESCLGLKKAPISCVERFSHILNAHHLWNARINGRDPQYGVWEVHKIKAWGDIHYDNQRDSFEIITNAEPLEKRISYETTDGHSYSSSLQDILFHIINHSTHHRGQIIMDLRTNDVEPPSLDYIHYKR
ncbi:MAG: DinB family protein [Robiginitalea sp.]|jgi:uncharacterized damage-inducible protein DinB